MENYAPAYLFNSDGSMATRPAITSVTPGVIGYGTTFQVQTPNAAKYLPRPCLCAPVLLRMHLIWINGS